MCGEFQVDWSGRVVRGDLVFCWSFSKVFFFNHYLVLSIRLPLPCMTRSYFACCKNREYNVQVAIKKSSRMASCITTYKCIVDKVRAVAVCPPCCLPHKARLL